MKLLLVRPNSKMSGVPPPIGLGYLSHAVKSTRGDETLIIEGRKFRLSEEAVLQRADSFTPDVIGVTAMSFEAFEATSVISRFKQKWPHVPVIIGGPHATACGSSLLNIVSADYLVVGEGEGTLIELLDVLEGKGDLASVKGLVWRNGKEVVFNGSRPYIDDLDWLEIDWEAIGPENYFGVWARNGVSTIGYSNRRLPVFTSRGCPYNCTYCHNIFGKKYRTFDTKRTVARMIELRDRYNLGEFEILDDNFNLDLGRAKEFMDQIIESKLGCALSFPNGLRADLVDEELIDLLARAGTYQIYYAIESASPRIQKLIRKNLDLERVREVVNMTASRRIVTGTYNMLGFPSETEEEMAMTVEYAVSLKNHVANFFYLNPFPGTEIAESQPWVSERSREMNFASYIGLTLNLSSVPDHVLINMRRSANRRFYFSLRRIARICRDVPKNLRFLASIAHLIKLSYRENSNY